MVVETQCARFDSISLDSGATLSPVEIAYETYGELNADRSNAHPDHARVSRAMRTRPASVTTAASRAGGTT